MDVAHGKKSHFRRGARSGPGLTAWKTLKVIFIAKYLPGKDFGRFGLLELLLAQLWCPGGRALGW